MHTREQPGRGRQKPLCPSARPDWKGARIIGVVRGTVAEPRVAYLSRALPVVDHVLDMAKPAAPTEVFRFGAPCANEACQHFHESRCHLVEKVVRELPVVARELPDCTVRESCRWFSQEGAEACWRCPRIVTDGPPLDPRMVVVTDPSR
jgi:hypothetical protein